MRKKLSVFLAMSLLVGNLSGCSAIKEKASDIWTRMEEAAQRHEEAIAAERAETMKDWVVVTLGSENGTTLTAQIPPDLAEAIDTQSDLPKWNYLTDYYGCELYVKDYAVDPSLAGTGWINEKLDDTSDLTGAEFYFAMACEDIRDGMQGQFESGIKEKTRTETLNEREWKLFTISVEQDKMKMNTYVYCYMDDTILTTVALMGAWDEDGVEKDDIVRLKDWLEIIPTTFSFADK